MAYEIFLKFLREKGFASEEITYIKKKEFRDLTQDLIDAQHKRMKRNLAKNPKEANYLELIRRLCNQNKFSIANTFVCVPEN